MCWETSELTPPLAAQWLTARLVNILEHGPGLERLICVHALIAGITSDNGPADLLCSTVLTVSNGKHSKANGSAGLCGAAAVDATVESFHQRQSQAASRVRIGPICTQTHTHTHARPPICVCIHYMGVCTVCANV